MRQQYAANPLTPQQQQAYLQAYSALDQARAQQPGLLSFGQNAMRGDYGFHMPTSFQGLLGGSPMPSGPPAASPLLEPPRMQIPTIPTPARRI